MTSKVFEKKLYEKVIETRATGSKIDERCRLTMDMFEWIS